MLACPLFGKFGETNRSSLTSEKSPQSTGFIQIVHRLLMSVKQSLQYTPVIIIHVGVEIWNYKHYQTVSTNDYTNYCLYDQLRIVIRLFHVSDITYIMYVFGKLSIMDCWKGLLLPVWWNRFLGNMFAIILLFIQRNYVIHDWLIPDNFY